MSINPSAFKTKQFVVFHNNSTMKVGTDAILLGMWCNVSNSKLIVDVGTGCGIIAMILASRSKAYVIGIDNNKLSIEEAKLNFSNSVMCNRLIAIEESFNNYSVNTNVKPDMVISNPPFFSSGLKSKNIARKSARHVNEMTHNNLCKGAAQILNSGGKLCVVLPFNLKEEFVSIAAYYGFNMERELIISPKPGIAPNRINMEFCKNNVENVVSELFTIRNSDNSYSNQYKNFVNELLWV